MLETKKMIFVIADDNMLNIYDSESELQGACEGIDVEEGVYQFFGPDGESLEAQFNEPNIKGKIFGPLDWVVSGKYILVPANEGKRKTLLQTLEAVVGLETNSYFQSLDEVKRFLTTASSKGPSGRDAQKTRAP